MKNISFSIQLPTSDALSLKSILQERCDRLQGIIVQCDFFNDTLDSCGDSNSLKSEISVTTISVTIGAVTTLVTALGSILKEWLRQRRTKIKITNSQSGVSIEYEGQLTPSFESKIDALLLVDTVSGPKSVGQNSAADRNVNERINKKKLP